MPIPFSCAFTSSSTFVSSVRRRNGRLSSVAIGSPGITSKINRSPSLRRASRPINVRLVSNLIFASGPFCGLFSRTSLKSRCITRLKETCWVDATGMDWMNARTGSATARVTGGTPPVLRSLAASTFFLIFTLLVAHNSALGAKGKNYKIVGQKSPFISLESQGPVRA
jgi:hypothetical protein